MESLRTAAQSSSRSATERHEAFDGLDTVTTNAKKRPGSLLFLGLARNCERTLPAFFSYLERLEDLGFRCAAIIGENGSRDSTRTLIERTRRVDLVDTGFMSGQSSRLVRMALGRQALLEVARKRGMTEGHVCVIDLDDAVLEPPEPKAVMAAIERLQDDQNLFAVGATSQPVYYDLLSLRTSGLDYSDLHLDILKAKKRPLSYFQFHQERIYNHQRRVPRLEPISCTSSFNGFCVYNAGDYALGSYRSSDESSVCEHVNFNLSIAGATGKRMLIAPELVIRAPACHIPVNFLRFWSDRIGEQLIEKIINPTLHKQEARSAAFVSKLYRLLSRSFLPWRPQPEPVLLDEPLEDL